MGTQVRGLAKPISILLVEDNPGDVELAKAALRESKLHNTLQVMNDGASVLAALSNTKKSHERPDLIFLDLNLPGVSGIEVLQKLKTAPGWSQIPVVILTSSQAETDIVKSYELHANCYVTKPLDFDRFMDVVRSIEEFWFSIVRLPGRL